jgi:hypothetical protein
MVKAEELLREYEVYAYAFSLKGITIPKFLAYLKSKDDSYRMLATEFTGNPLRKEKLTPEIIQGAHHALTSLHDFGILHGCH